MTFNNDIDYEDLTKILAESFNLLADEVQLLSDRKIILEHKLRYAHEQYQQLADKYASGDAEIANTLAKLQLPQDPRPSTPDRAGFVPLPRNQTLSKQQTAIAIRDGRKAAQQLNRFNGQRLSSTTSGRSQSGASSFRFSARRTSLSTVLEQDFTVAGKQGSLHCPFSKGTTPDIEDAMSPVLLSGNDKDFPSHPIDTQDPTPHQSRDPICAALYSNITASAPPSAVESVPKCPIRYLDQHSPEEVAAYFETHKHEIPRSHEVCVRRYQRNEADIRKLDAKYGSLVNMIQGLGQKHQPMLATKEDEDSIDLDEVSNHRVENWAQAVGADGEVDDAEQIAPPAEDDDRESRFDRPLKEVRVGESPSRPWGISVPIFDAPVGDPPESPSPAPVSASHIPKLPAGKCPFGHGQAALQKPEIPLEEVRPAGRWPFGHGQKARSEDVSSIIQQSRHNDDAASVQASVRGSSGKAGNPLQEEVKNDQPAFINPLSIKPGNGVPQMIFTGPVFIGYPIEDAMKFMSQYKSG